MFHVFIFVLERVEAYLIPAWLFVIILCILKGQNWVQC
jgi:hypothetical protein